MSMKKTLKSVAGHFNFSTSVTVNSRTFSVPIIANLGHANRKLGGGSWVLSLIQAIGLPHGAAFVDVGVNVGQTLLAFRSAFENPYWGFEPNPNCVFYLKVLSRDNQLKDVNILPVGLSGANTIGRFFSKGDADAAATTVASMRPDYYDRQDASYVPLFRFDDLRLEGLDRIAFIKIDVEGGELEVISGMAETLQAHRPYLICEVLDYHSADSGGPTQQRAESLTALVRDAGYDMFRIISKADTPVLQPVPEIALRLWTPESPYLNDYLFAPREAGLEGRIRSGEVALPLADA